MVSLCDGSYLTSANPGVMTGFHGFWLFSAIRLLLDLQVGLGNVVVLRLTVSGGMGEANIPVCLD